jgi:glycosyltransferase involved in cell wall biosynthesis
VTCSASIWFLVPGDPETPTGGYRYDRRIIEGLGRLSRSVRLERLADSFPEPTRSDLADAERRLQCIPDGGLVVVDGLAFGVMGEVAARHQRRLHLIALVHHPLALETGLAEARADALLESESRALAFADRVVVTSTFTAVLLAKDYGVPEPRISVVEPGTDPAPVAVGSGADCLNLLCVAAPTPRKGHDILLHALAPLVDRSWRLDCVGSLERCRRTSLEVQRLSDRLGLTERVRFRGTLDDAGLDDLYHSADVFVLPTRFEGYGMVLTEALARGLPVVSTRVGPVPAVVPREAGLLVAPDDPTALQQGLARVLDDAELRCRLAVGARAARGRLRSWEDASSHFASVLDELLDG